jgi:citrate synthase
MDDEMSAAEAAVELGISRATLYAYVSRGMIRSQSGDVGRRTRRYSAADVRKLKDRQEVRRDPGKVADSALDWGAPIRASALTLIENGRLYYRGRDAITLARDLSVEQTAALLWLGSEDESIQLFAREPAPIAHAFGELIAGLPNTSPVEQFQVALPLMAVEDLEAYDFRPAQVAMTGARLLKRMALLATGGRENDAASIAESLAQAWRPDLPAAVPLLSAALILCADHELNVSSFTARCVASAGSSPYAVVSAGLAALLGMKHGGSTDRVEALFQECGDPGNARTTLARRVRRGETVPGFGHPLYPDGDPRGRALLELAVSACAEARGLKMASALAEQGTSILHLEPNLDFGLCAVRAALDLPPGSALTLFALGRTIGWIAHAIEEYEADALIRPRARYTGVRPNERL